MHRSISILKGAIIKTKILFIIQSLEPCLAQSSRGRAVSGKTNSHVDILKYPGGEFLFSTWGRKKSSEESNETSEEMNHAHVENKKYPRGDLRFSTWIFEKRRESEGSGAGVVGEVRPDAGYS